MPPNILWIVVDELRPDALGCYGSPIASTPNIDALARRGTLMRRAYCQSPVCVPSRASFMTGKHCQTIRVYDNAACLNVGSWHRERLRAAVTPEQWGTRLSDAHARFRALTAPFGHPTGEMFERLMAGLMATRQLVWDLGLDEEGPRHAMFPELLSAAGYRTVNLGKLHHQGPREGFDENPIIESTDALCGWGWRLDANGDEARAVRLHAGVYGKGIVVGGRCPLPANETPEALVTDEAIRVLQAPGERPLLLRVSYTWPHTPVLPPEPYDAMFDPAQFSRPTEAGPVPAADAQRARADYYGLVSYMDAEIGRLLAAVPDDTVVVFHADHGTLHGEHGRWQKGVFYDPVVRVPFIIAAPGVEPGRTIDALVELTDIAPTLLSLGGAAVPPDIDGLDLMPLLTGATQRLRDAAFSDIGASWSDDPIPDEPRLIRRFVTDGEWRLDVTADGTTFSDAGLYNLVDDPLELRNRAGEAEAHERLAGLVCDRVATAPREPVLAGSSPRGDNEPTLRRWM